MKIPKEVEAKIGELAHAAAMLADKAGDGDGRLELSDVLQGAANVAGASKAFLNLHAPEIEKQFARANRSLKFSKLPGYAVWRPFFRWPVLVALLLAMVAGAVFLAPRDSLPTTAGLACGGAIAARLDALKAGQDALDAGQIRIMATSQATAQKVDDMAALIETARRMKPAERKSWAEDFFGGLR